MELEEVMNNLSDSDSVEMADRFDEAPNIMPIMMRITDVHEAAVITQQFEWER